MQSIDQLYCCHVPGQMFGTWKVRCQVRIYYPHPEVQTVIITDMGLKSGWFVPCKIESLATLIVKEFGLNPDLVVWIEHYSRQFKKPSSPDFSQVTFDWLTGKATRPEWTAISEEMAQTLAGGESLQPAIHSLEKKCPKEPCRNQ